MSHRILTPDEIHGLLARNGHSIRNERSEKDFGTEVGPPSDVIVTVGLNLDPTLKPAYRERYFACLVDEDHRPVLGDEPGFDLAEPFATLSRQAPPAGGFMEGPFRWLLRRLARFPRVLLWPGMTYRAADEGGFVRPSLLDDLPQL